MFKEFTEFNINTYTNKIECFGISLDNEKIIQMKCYRWAHSEYKKAFKEECYCEFLNAIEKENLGYLFDYTQGVEDNKIVCRATCKIKNCSIYGGFKLFERLKQHLDMKLCEELIEFYIIICKYLKSKKSPIAEMGIKFIEGEKLGDIKIYYTLRKFEGINDILGKIIRFEDNINFFSNAFTFFKVNELNKAKIVAISENLEKSGYLPTLFGINKNSKETICKIYYELTDYEKQILKLNDNLYELFRKISKYINICTKKIYEIVLFYESIDFYLRGIAFDFTLRENYIKLYFYMK